MRFHTMVEFMEVELTSEQIKLRCGVCVCESCVGSKLPRSHTRMYVVETVIDFRHVVKEVGLL